MKKTLKNLFIFCIVLFACNFALAQNIETALQQSNTQAPQEKLYLHFDNSNYTNGQTIWYKAYLMNGFQPSQLSKNLYVDWYDDNGALISATASPIAYSYAAGHFKVPDNYTGNNLHAIAYTKWMRNFDSAYFFQQHFKIVNKSTQSIAQQKNIKESSIQFLPESGNLINNKLNVIAFKTLNGLGLPESITGIIKNTKGDSVTSFKTIHDGMGKFQFVPLLGQKYTAIWTDVLGIKHNTPLPIAEEVGVNLNVEPGRSNRIFHVQRTKDVPASMQQLNLVGQMNGSILFMAKLNLTDKESITSTLPLNKMLTGILKLTLFDANNSPLCERQLFVKNEDYKLNTTVTIDTLNALKRGKNVYEIELKDTTYASYSLAITDATTNQYNDNNIVSHLLLNGELAGHVNNPAYYFSSSADSVANHLDLVMLTNGWSRYNWKAILSNATPDLKYARDSVYQTLNGKIADYGSKKPKKPETINLIFVAKDSSNNMITLPVMEDGSFTSANAMLYDTTKIYFKINGTTAVSNKNITIENDLFKPDSKLVLDFSKSTQDTAGLSQLQAIINEQLKFDALNKNNSLKEVTVFSKQKTRLKELDKKYTFGIFSGEATAAFDMSSFENASHTIDIFDFLTGKVPGLEVGNNIGGTASLGVLTYRGGSPSFYLDETPLQTSDLYNVDVKSLAYVKVFTNNFMGGLNPSGGIIASNANGGMIASGAAIVMYKKRGLDIINQNNSFNSNGMDYKSYIGYVAHKEFYSPNYAEKSQDNLKDLRTTLLWNPWINLDKMHQKVKVEFYNNDVTKNFRLVLEGMDSKGKLVSIQKVLK
jgi:hypothetical protein